MYKTTAATFSSIDNDCEWFM